MVRVFALPQGAVPGSLSWGTDRLPPIDKSMGRSKALFQDCVPDSGNGGCDVFLVDAVVGHDSNLPLSHDSDQNASGLGAFGKLGRCQAAGLQIEKDDVRFHSIKIEENAGNLGNASRELLRVLMVIRETVDHRLKSDDSGRGDDPDLPHSSADHLALSAGLGYVFLGAAQHRSRRRAQPF